MRLAIEVAEDGADDEYIDQLTRELRSALLEAEVDEVTVPIEGVAPEGSRAVSPAAVGALLVTAKGSVDLVRQVVDIVRAWWQRRPRQRTLKITVGENVLELSNATEDQQDRLVEQFVHAVTLG